MKTVETVKLRQLRKTLATSENFGNLGKPLTNVVSNENENDEIIYLSTRKGRPNDFFGSGLFGDGNRYRNFSLRPRHAWSASRSPKRKDVVSASCSFFVTPGNFQFCVARDDWHLFPFSIRHCDFRMHGASNEGSSAVLSVRSDLSKELLWRRFVVSGGNRWSSQVKDVVWKGRR
jgi:hypothetical protein